MNEKETVLVEHTCSQGHKTEVRMIVRGERVEYAGFANNLCTHNYCDRVAIITDEKYKEKPQKKRNMGFWEALIWSE